MSAAVDWEAELGVAVKRYPIVFVHLGRSRLPKGETLEALGRVVTVADYLGNVGDQGEGGDATAGSVVVISDVESVVGSRRLTLGALRERVMSDVDEGGRIVLQSRLARGAFPETLGSNLLADAKQVFAPALLTDHAQGLERLPGWRGGQTVDAAGSAIKKQFFVQCVEELGVDTVSCLAELLWDARLSPNETLESVSGVDLESLLSSGLVSLVDDHPTWVISSEWSHFREAVAAVSSRYASEGDWLARTFVDLWLIERSIRNAFRDAFIAGQGAGWRSTCLPVGLQAEVVGRAQRDSQPLAAKISDLRDPLEWLTTSELLDLRTDRNLGLLGLEPHQWAKLREAIVPARNRAAHMRIIGERDARTVATWRKLVELKVTATQQRDRPSRA